MIVFILMCVILFWGVNRIYAGIIQLIDRSGDEEDDTPEVHNHYNTEVQIHNSFNRSDYHAAQTARHSEEEDTRFNTKRW